MASKGQQAQVFDFRTKLRKVSTGAGGKNEAPSFKLPLLSVATEHGKKIILKCSVTGNPKPAITWYKNEQKLVADDVNVKIYEDKKESTIKFLEIARAEMTDAGEYVCEASNAVGKDTTSGKVTIKKQAPAKLEEKLKDVSVNKGTSLKLKIKADGMPIPQVKWFKNGKEITEKKEIEIISNSVEGIYELIVYDVNDTHAGTYKVEVSNRTGTDSSQAKVQILAARRAPSFDAPLKGIGRIGAGEEYKMTTRIGGNPKPKVCWLKDGVQLKSGEGGIEIVADEATGLYTLTIRDFGPEHVGSYTVEASSEAGKETSSLEVQPAKPLKKPKVEMPLADAKVLKGTPLRLVTKVSAEPVPSVSWFLNGQELEHKKNGIEMYYDFETGEAELVAPEMSPNKAGEFMCVATNRLGSEKTTAKIFMSEPNQQKPSFETPLTATYDPSKKMLILRCKPVGYPEPVLEWLAKDQPLLPSDEVSLKNDPADVGLVVCTISNFTELKEGEYSVIARSASGVVKRSINVTLQQTKTENTNRPQFELPLKVDFDSGNSQIILRCRVVGDPLPNVSWLKDNVEIKGDDFAIEVDDQNNHQLTISNVSPAHHGDYSCLATSTHGIAKQTCTLVLKEKPKLEVISKPSLEKGKDFDLSFRVTGGENIRVCWYRNGEKMENGENISTTTGPAEDGIGTISTLKIIKLGEEHTGDYTIEAVGEGGTVRSTISLNFSESGAAERCLLVVPLDSEVIVGIARELGKMSYKPAAGKVAKVRVEVLLNQYSGQAMTQGHLGSGLGKGDEARPIFIYIWEGKGVATAVKNKIAKAEKQSIFSQVLYASETAEAGKKDAGIWFKPYEIMPWKASEISLLTFKATGKNT